MSVSDIDDGECDNFVQVLMHNRHLKVLRRASVLDIYTCMNADVCAVQELDMSGNLLGKDENLSSVQDGVVTGGESIAGLLRQETCPIRCVYACM